MHCFVCGGVNFKVVMWAGYEVRGSGYWVTVLGWSNGVD